MLSFCEKSKKFVISLRGRDVGICNLSTFFGQVCEGGKAVRGVRFFDQVNSM